MKQAVCGDVLLRSLDVSDLDAIVATHSAAFPKSAMTKLGREAVRRYYAWQFEGPHENYPFGVLVDGTLAGFCFGGIFPSAISGFLQRNRVFLTWRVVTHPWLLANPLFRGRLESGLAMLKSLGRGASPTPAPPPPAPGEPKRPFDILSIAVDPRFQRMGLGKIMMAEAQAIALRNGFHVMTLFVNRDNEQAIRFYEAIGWERALMKGVWRGNMVKWLNSAIKGTISTTNGATR
ncbi:MAG: GNAT family N-acetyltransferase [Vulcanimicrobiaceae bacterium]